MWDGKDRSDQLIPHPKSEIRNPTSHIPKPGLTSDNQEVEV
jgi:hypothetical protein